MYDGSYGLLWRNTAKQVIVTVSIRPEFEIIYNAFSWRKDIRGTVIKLCDFIDVEVKETAAWLPLE